MKINALKAEDKVIFTSGNGIRHGLAFRQRSIGVVADNSNSVVTLKTQNCEQFDASTGLSKQSQARISIGTKAELEEVAKEEASRK